MKTHFITKAMSWEKAVKFMQEGGAIRRKSWRVDDFLYLKDGVLFCDGGYEYLSLLQGTNGSWYGLTLDVWELKAI